MRKVKSKPNLLLVGPMPPPIGGDTVSFHKLVNNHIFNDYYNIKIISTRPVYLREKRNIFDVLRFFFFVSEFILHFYKYNVVFFNINRDFSISGFIVPFILCKIFRKKIVLKTFGSGLDILVDKLNPLHKKIVFKVFKSIDILFPQTIKLFKWFEGNGFKCQCFPNWIQKDYIKLKDVDVRKNFIFVGQVKKEKGVINLIDSMNALPDVQCHFYGPILKRDESAFLSKLMFSKNCEYRGVLDREELGDVIEKYKYLILPTFYIGEGVPAVLLESIAKGVPVVASRQGGITDLISKQNGILFDTENELTSALLKANDLDSELYLKMSKAGVNRAKNFSDSVVIENLCKRINLLFDT